MNKLRLVTSAEQLDYTKIIEPKYEVGLVPVVCIDAKRMAADGLLAYRMQGFANQVAVERTLEIGMVTFYSRKRNGLWTKGEESGNSLLVRGAFTDCDQDSLLLDVDAQGPTCHLNAETCFSLPTIGE